MFQYPVQSVRTRSSIRPSGHKRLHPPWSESPLHNRWQAPNGRSFHSPFPTPQTLRSANSSAHRLYGQSSPTRLVHCPFACSQIFTPFNSLVSGKLTLRQVNGGKPFSRTLRAISRIYSLAGSKSASGVWLHSEKPIEGTPFRQPSITTPIVPE